MLPFEIKYGKKSSPVLQKWKHTAFVKHQLDVIIREAARCHLAICAQRRLAVKIHTAPGFELIPGINRRLNPQTYENFKLEFFCSLKHNNCRECMKNQVQHYLLRIPLPKIDADKRHHPKAAHVGRQVKGSGCPLFLDMRGSAVCVPSGPFIQQEKHHSLKHFWSVQPSSIASCSLE